MADASLDLLTPSAVTAAPSPPLESPLHLAPRATAPHKQRRGKRRGEERGNNGRGGERAGRSLCRAGGREERRIGRAGGREGRAAGGDGGPRAGGEGGVAAGVWGGGCVRRAVGVRRLERISTRTGWFAVCYRSGTRQKYFVVCFCFCRVFRGRHTAKRSFAMCPILCTRQTCAHTANYHLPVVPPVGHKIITWPTGQDISQIYSLNNVTWK